MINEIYILLLKSNLRYLVKVWSLFYQLMDGWNHDVVSKKNKKTKPNTTIPKENHTISYKQILRSIDECLLLIAVEKVKYLYHSFYIF